MRAKCIIISCGVVISIEAVLNVGTSRSEQIMPQLSHQFVKCHLIVMAPYKGRKPFHWRSLCPIAILRQKVSTQCWAQFRKERREHAIQKEGALFFSSGRHECPDLPVQVKGVKGKTGDNAHQRWLCVQISLTIGCPNGCSDYQADSVTAAFLLTDWHTKLIY